MGVISWDLDYLLGAYAGMHMYVVGAGVHQHLAGVFVWEGWGLHLMGARVCLFVKLSHGAETSSAACRRLHVCMGRSAGLGA